MICLPLPRSFSTEGLAPQRALHVTKSSLSKQVARLEECYGVRQIKRSTRSLRITPVGRAVYEQCETIVAAASSYFGMPNVSFSLA
jgi:DNA-binding transcriptional LysR family regulator